MGKAAYQKPSTPVGDTPIELIELSANEYQLIKAIRQSVRFGEIIIKVRDGQPYQLVRIQEFVKLSTDSA